MSLPPVVQRIHGKSVSDDEIRAYFATGENPERFAALFVRFRERLQDLAVELVHLPDDDPWWKQAPQTQNFGGAVRDWLEYRRSKDPHDEVALWGRLASGVMGGSLMGDPEWLPLLRSDLRNIRWLVDSGLWVGLNAGHDATSELRGLLERLARERPGVRAKIERLAANGDPPLSEAAGIALRVMEGRSLFDQPP